MAIASYKLPPQRENIKIQIGLEPKETKTLAEKLNNLLANYQVFYRNARGFHWNITGEKFFELHAKFEELYNNLLVKVGEVAERILALGQAPLHTFSEYIPVPYQRSKERLKWQRGDANDFRLL